MIISDCITLSEAWTRHVLRSHSGNREAIERKRNCIFTTPNIDPGHAHGPEVTNGL